MSILSEIFNQTDTVTMEIPFLIRILEWAREDAKSDMQLHTAVENMLKQHQTLTMQNYSEIIA